MRSLNKIVTGDVSGDAAASTITGLSGDRVVGFYGDKVKGRPGQAASLVITLLRAAIASGLRAFVPVFLNAKTGAALASGQLASVTGAAAFIWDAPAGGAAATGYRLYWGTSPGSYPSGPHNDTGANRMEFYTALGLAADTTYYVVARAFNGTGESGNSNEIQVRNGVQIGP